MIVAAGLRLRPGERARARRPRRLRLVVIGGGGSIPWRCMPASISAITVSITATRA